MRTAEEIREKIEQCVTVLKELSGKPDMGGADFVIADRNVTTMSTLLWVLDEQPSAEMQKLAGRVLQKFQPGR